MTLDIGLASLTRLAFFTVRRPRAGAEFLIGLKLPREVIWPSVLLVAVISTLLYAVQDAIDPATSAQISLSPVALTLVSIFSMIAVAGGIQIVGAMLGGSGGFWDALLLITFMQAILIGLQVIQSLVSLLTSALSGIFIFVGLALTLWLLINFTAALHRYSSLAKAFGVVALAFFATGMVLAIVLGFAGVGGA